MTSEDYVKHNLICSFDSKRLLDYIYTYGVTLRADKAAVIILHNTFDLFYYYYDVNEFYDMAAVIKKYTADAVSKALWDAEQDIAGRKRESNYLTGSNEMYKHTVGLEVCIDDVIITPRQWTNPMEVVVQDGGYRYRRRAIDHLEPMLRKSGECVVTIHDNETASQTRCDHLCSSVEVYLLKPKKFYILIEK